MPFDGRDVVVTGGTGALGGAVVGALVQAGASCTVPWLHGSEAERFPYRESKQVRLVGPVNLADEDAVKRLFDGVSSLWASVHIAGGFAMSPVAKTSKADLMKLIDMNFVRSLLPLLGRRRQCHRPHWARRPHRQRRKIGSASCRERVRATGSG